MRIFSSLFQVFSFVSFRDMRLTKVKKIDKLQDKNVLIFWFLFQNLTLIVKANDRAGSKCQEFLPYTLKVTSLASLACNEFLTNGLINLFCLKIFGKCLLI